MQDYLSCTARISNRNEEAQHTKGAWKIVEKKTVGYTENVSQKCLEDLQPINHMHFTSPLVLDYCGREQCIPGHKFGPYVRENYVLHIVLRGKGSLRARDKTYQISAGQVFAIYPEEETVYQADEQDPWEYLWIGFHGFDAERIVHHIGFSRDSLVVSIVNMYTVSGGIEKIFSARQPTIADEMKRASYLYAVIALLLEGSQSRIDDRDQEYPDKVYVKMAVDIIMHSYAEKLKISEIASTIGISRGYLTSLFKREMNMSPQSFLMNFRMEKAAQLLKETNEPVRSVGISVGYTDSLSFSKTFKQKFHMSPSAYRELQLELVEVKEEYIRQYPL